MARINLLREALFFNNKKKNCIKKFIIGFLIPFLFIEGSLGEETIVEEEKPSFLPHIKGLIKKQSKKYYLSLLGKKKILTQKSKDKLLKEDEVFFKLHEKCADRWIKAIERYQKPETRYNKSAKFAYREFLSIEKLFEKVNHSFQVPITDKLLAYLTKRFQTVKCYEGRLTNDKEIVFNTMLACAEDYIKVIKENRKAVKNIRILLGNFIHYVNKAEVFLHRHLENFSPHKHCEI